jgi:hypothetical protein
MPQSGSVPTSGRSRLKFAVVAMLGVAALAGSVVTASASTVTQLIFTPAPVGTVNSVAAGSTVTVTLTAEDATNTPVPGVAVWVSFNQAPSGGTAFVGTTGLGSRVQPFTTDGSGHVSISYSTPSVYPTSNNSVDVIHAQNGASRITSTTTADTSFSYSNIIALVFTPTPIARQGSLGPSHSVTVTLTVFGPGGTRLANAPVDLSFHQGKGGGSASVGATALGHNPISFMTNAAGQVIITYMTPSVLPVVITSDKLIASDAPKFGAVTAGDAYRY